MFSVDGWMDGWMHGWIKERNVMWQNVLVTAAVKRIILRFNESHAICNSAWRMNGRWITIDDIIIIIIIILLRNIIMYDILHIILHIFITIKLFFSLQIRRQGLQERNHQKDGVVHLHPPRRVIHPQLSPWQRPGCSGEAWKGRQALQVVVCFLLALNLRLKFKLFIL